MCIRDRLRARVEQLNAEYARYTAEAGRLREQQGRDTLCLLYTSIPDGRILPVEGTDFDLRKAALLGERNSAAHPDTCLLYTSRCV